MDMTPDIKLSLVQLNQQIRKRALAVLAAAEVDYDLTLDAVAGAFWADILFVSSYKRANLDTNHTDALAKVSTALGYLPTQYALLHTDDLPQTDLTTYLNAFQQALCAQTLVFLEKETAEQHVQHSNKDELCVKTVVVTDFFGSLQDCAHQIAQKQQAWQELQPARRIPAMR